jgi:opacity protein-like surface antigen
VYSNSAYVQYINNTHIQLLATINTMKIKNINFLIIILFSLNIFSQNEFRLGLSGGLNFSSIVSNNSVNSNSRFGYLLGVDAEYYLNNSFSIKSGINYENKVVSKFNVMTGNLLDGNDNYIILPILLKYDFGKSNNYFVNGGYFFGYLLSKFEDDYGIIRKTNNKTDSGISIGIGKKIKLTGDNIITLELRNNFGLNNIFDNEKNTPPNFEKKVLRTNSINLIVSWNFKI